MDLTQVVDTESKDQIIKSSKSVKKTKTGKKIGRPSVADEYKRNNKVVLYFTNDELELISKVCGKKSISSYIRDKILFQFK